MLGLIRFGADSLFSFLYTGLENAKVVGWVLEMHVSNTTTFFSRIATGSILSLSVENCLYFLDALSL